MELACNSISYYISRLIHDGDIYISDIRTSQKSLEELEDIIIRYSSSHVTMANHKLVYIKMPFI